jgi:hypothetical protein
MFITNRISTGKGRSFDEIVAEYRAKQEKVKTASTNEPVVKTAEQEEADSSGQLDVEPLHQKGESTTMPKNGPSAKTEGEDGGKGSKSDTGSEKEGKDSEQPKWEGKQENNNKPEVKEESKGGSDKRKTKEAALEDLPQEVQDKIKGKKKNNKDEEDSDETSNEEKDVSKESEVEKDEKKEKKANEKIKFVKIANLNAKNKEFLRKFWTKLYGEDYVNALLADK